MVKCLRNVSLGRGGGGGGGGVGGHRKVSAFRNSESL